MTQQGMLAPTPPMGWNSWNTFDGAVDAELICSTADAMKSKGLLEAGYRYVIIDDCWSLRERGASGQLVPDPQKFPDGIASVADYVHSLGLRFGIYSCCGTKTCAGYPGSFGHEYQDAATFASWGVDYLKYDNCYRPRTLADPLLYRRMGNALRSCGRDIVYAACQWGTEDVWHWIRSTGANTFRSTGDIADTWQSIADIAMSQIDKQCFSGPDCFNDMDMLVVGMRGKSRNDFVAADRRGCSEAEYLCHFALWCFMASPLIMGCDVRHIPKDAHRILTNPDLIAIDQDIECRPAQVIHVAERRFVLAKMLHGGDIALGFFNLTDSERLVDLNLWDIGMPDGGRRSLELYDCVAHENAGSCREYLGFPVAPHSCRVFRASIA